jgi:hypothetical protein
MRTRTYIGENRHGVGPGLSSGRPAAKRIDHPCSVRQLCPRCSLMKVIQYRFKAFKRAFGREPLPNEPLFFAATAAPQRASSEQMMRQLEQAANAMGIALAPVLKMLEKA